MHLSALEFHCVCVSIIIVILDSFICRLYNNREVIESLVQTKLIVSKFILIDLWAGNPLSFDMKRCFYVVVDWKERKDIKRLSSEMNHITNELPL